MKKQLLCINCPTGCQLEAELLPDGELVVTGNKCKKGIAFAHTELTFPTRTLTTTVRTTVAGVPVLPVRTNGEIPKTSIPAAMREIAAITITKPLACGDVVLQNLADSGIDLIATSNLLLEV